MVQKSGYFCHPTKENNSDKAFNNNSIESTVAYRRLDDLSAGATAESIEDIRLSNPQPTNGDLTSSHYKEWIDSKVSPDFIALNVRSLDGYEAYEAVSKYAAEAAEESSRQMANSAVYAVERMYRPIKEGGGGWWASGLDPLNKYEPMEWGQLKPNTPRVKADGKIQKYEAPAKLATGVFLPNVPLSDALAVLERFNSSVNVLERLSDKDLKKAVQAGKGGFWKWFRQHPQIPLVLTEGAKKAGASFNAGFAAISVPGVWNACKPKIKDADGFAIPDQVAFLKDEILMFCQTGRKIILAFDQDEKAKTKKDVSKASNRTAFLVERDSKAKAFFASWKPSHGKGIDDLIANKGADAFALAISSAVSRTGEKVRRQVSGQLKRQPDLVVNQKLIDIDLDALPRTGIVALVSAHGTGKTQKFLVPLLETHKKALLIGHLVSLTKANSQRMSCTYRSDLDRAAGRFINDDGEAVYKVSTVIDSLMSFNPKDFDGAAIVGDEIVQLLRSMLTSTNIGNKGNRGAILTRIHDILQRAAVIYLADADLNDWALDYIEKLRGDGEKAFLIRNDYKAKGYKAHLFNASSPDALIEAALTEYRTELAKGELGKHIVIGLDTKSKAEVLAKRAETEIEGAEVLAIHGDSSSGDIEQAFIKNPDDFLSYQDKPLLLIYSPSLATGVSIENQNIGHVYGIFQGSSIIDTDIIQMLGRVRVPCPRSVWINEKGNSYNPICRDGSAEAIKAALKNSTDTTALSIRHGLTETAYSGLGSFEWDTDPHIHAYCETQAERNRCMPNLRARVVHWLKERGNHIASENVYESKITGQIMREVREQLNKEDAEAIGNAEPIDSIRAELIAAKEAPTPEERNQLSKFHLSDFYLAQVTAELVLEDRKGEKRRQIRAYEELMDTEVAVKRDVAVIEKQLKWGNLTPQDIRHGATASQVRKLIGLDKWIERKEPWLGSCDELAEFKALCLQERVKSGIKLSLGYTVKADATAQQILGDLLGQVGVSCENSRKRIDRKPQRLYSIDAEALADIQSIVDRRKAKNDPPPSETEAVKQFAGDPPPSDAGDKTAGDPPPSIYINQQGGVDHLKEEVTPIKEVVSATAAAPCFVSEATVGEATVYRYIGSDYPDFQGIDLTFYSWGYQNLLANVRKPDGTLINCLPIAHLERVEVRAMATADG
jgi:hypothetical protein